METKSDLTDNLKRQMFLRVIWFDKQLEKELEKRDSSMLTEAQAGVVMILNGGSRSISEIARGLGVSRQAAHKTVNELIRNKWLTLKPSARKNEKIVDYSDYGIEQREIAAASIRAVERIIVNKIGVQKTSMLREVLMQDWED